ncbi:uncharacterized protein LOC122791517 [Protopterus annectens]|uniref:uncharacterized protein LOC122791517 n=1 Tax=Protopterus annectens TaxID=7888 RepID=UPI001CF94A10|nr:uncharacterized protein LOC122791517 [Protopterus annectens]
MTLANTRQGLHFLKNFLCNHGLFTMTELIPEGFVALKTDNGKYWHLDLLFFEGQVEAEKSRLDSTCQFLVLPASSGKVYIKTPQNKYLKRHHLADTKWEILELAKGEPDVSCEFQLHNRNGKVYFMADNGKYLSRVCRFGKETIEAFKEQVDMYCLFEMVEYQMASTSGQTKTVKRKIADERRVFQEKWTDEYFFVEFNNKALCLVCREVINYNTLDHS